MAATRQSGGPYRGGGALKYVWYGARIAGQVDAAVQRAMEETAVAAKADARGRARVDTGAMRDGIDAEVTTTGAGRRRMTLSGSVSYTLFHELGTSKLSAQPMLRPAIDQEAGRLSARIKAALGGGG